MSEELNESYISTKIVKFIEKHPLSWMILGLLLTFIVNGALKLRFLGQSIIVTEYANSAFRISVHIVSMILVFSGLYILVKDRLKSSKVVGYILGVLFLATIILFTVKSLENEASNDDYLLAFKEWEIEKCGKEKKVEVKLRPRFLKKFHEQDKCIFLAIHCPKTITTKGIHKYDSHQIAIGSKYPIENPDTDEMTITMEWSTNYPTLVYGDVATFAFFTADKNINLQDCHSLNDLLDAGAESIGHKTKELTVNGDCQLGVIEWINTLSIDTQKKIKESIGN